MTEENSVPTTHADDTAHRASGTAACGCDAERAALERLRAHAAETHPPASLVERTVAAARAQAAEREAEGGGAQRGMRGARRGVGRRIAGVAAAAAVAIGVGIDLLALPLPAEHARQVSAVALSVDAGVRVQTLDYRGSFSADGCTWAAFRIELVWGADEAGEVVYRIEDADAALYAADDTQAAVQRLRAGDGTSAQVRTLRVENGTQVAACVLAVPIGSDAKDGDDAGGGSGNHASGRSAADVETAGRAALVGVRITADATLADGTREQAACLIEG